MGHPQGKAQCIESDRNLKPRTEEKGAQLAYGCWPKSGEAGPELSRTGPPGRTPPP